MNNDHILRFIGEQISRLQQARDILAGDAFAKRGPGRPKGIAKKRALSVEARAKIAAAQKKRWAKQRDNRP